MGKTQDVDLRAELPVSALKLPPQSDEARELWKKMLFKSVSPEEFKNLPRPSEEDLQAALDEGRRHVDQVRGVAHIPSVRLANPEQAKDLAVELIGEPAPTNEITFADFEKVDIRVGQVMSAERVPKSDKLLKLEVDFGPLGMRTILAGIAKAEAYPSPTILVGNRFAFVVNLAPRKMMGIMSHGMSLAAGTGSGDLTLLKCGNVPSGTRVG